MSKRDIEIKITKDKRFNVAGLTVNTLDEAFDRYDKKMKREPSDSNWYFLVGKTIMISLTEQERKMIEENYISSKFTNYGQFSNIGKEILTDFGLPGNRQFVTTCVNDLLNLM